MKSPTGQYSYRQAIMTFQTRCRVRDVFYMVSHRSTVTSPKPLTDKPHYKQTSRKDKQTGLEHVPDPNCFCGSGSRFRIHITLYNPLPCDRPFISHFKDDRSTLRANGRSLERLFGFIEYKFLLYIISSRHRRHQNPALAQPASPSPPPPRRRWKPLNQWVLPWILQREEGGCYKTVLDELITTDIPGYRNFTRIEPAFFYFIEERITTSQPRKSITNFRKPLEVGQKLAVTLRHLSTEESYTSLQYQWRVGRMTICKFVPQVCKAILKEFQQEYLVCPTDPEDWKKIEERFRNRLNVCHAVGALDGKHIAIKKSKESGRNISATRATSPWYFWL